MDKIPNAHVTVALCAVASFAVLHDLPIVALHGPDSGSSVASLDHTGLPDAITVDLGFDVVGSEILDGWLAALYGHDPIPDDALIVTDHRAARVQRYVDSDTTIPVPAVIRVLLGTTLPDLGIRIVLDLRLWDRA